MLSLENQAWSNLDHAYGEASDIPDLLRQLEEFPPSGPKNEPWFSLWSALAHQGDVYSASFAAVPHITRVIATAPERTTYDFFLLPTWIEICRYRKGITVPDTLSAAYTQAIETLPSLVCAVTFRPWSEDFRLSALAAIAVSKGSADLAETILELTPDTIKDFQAWQNSR
ncbi:hypothetical protein [Granulicella mallensis]|uniref:Uncharacterized protein n=1 Tax=Granulicella mallensis (strain ATCC BAA-1857 / DSM 23137 / MP5ACTX8) TaxID=682795 RepID=G8NYX2_GRAMM|nr:hypothetical protein [Granulicella mallensis]AEU35624.1 hypothetical protein AciX8_1281 [Granulicella mallensis MP5ACTX8]